MDINDILLDLEIIKQIQENDKLAVSVLPGKTRLFVHSKNIFSAFSRWYSGYNREDCITYLEKLVETIQKSSNIIIDGHHTDIAVILKRAISSSIIGFETLKETYRIDSIISAKLILIINSLKSIISNLESFINASNDIVSTMDS